MTTNPAEFPPAQRPGRARHHHRSLFLSDLHLGARNCDAGRILGFLTEHDADTFYLVGDIFDIWHVRKPHWTPVHDAIVAILRTRAQRGARIVYLSGNHDAAKHRHHEGFLGPVEVAEHAFHVAADGRRYLVLHGDVCDARWLRWHALTRLGSRADESLRSLDAWLRRLRNRADPERATTIQMLLSCVNGLLSFGTRFETRLADLARRHDQDGVICGHFHKAALHGDHGVVYANCGDWVDSCTAIAEHRDGTLMRLAWQDERQTARAPEGAGFDDALAGFA
ncbi:UDP-2,3-diacylglucosamine diphosphatase [Paracoccaceae bacterium Fryx2]|nr:UDP-2,3-diacylglucosamine diphosphatase [Paracoccaceae bacterium Fryx2]